MVVDPFMTMGDARRVHRQQADRITQLERYNQEMQSMLKSIADQILTNDPPVWYPREGEVNKLVQLAGGFYGKSQKREEKKAPA